MRSVLIAGWLRRLDPRTIRDRASAADRYLRRHVGGTPAYIDGHQHVHLLPGVREAVTEAAGKLGAYVRSTREPITRAMLNRPAPVDSAYLSWAARPLLRLANRRGVRTNTGFRGVRSFNEHGHFAICFDE